MTRSAPPCATCPNTFTRNRFASGAPGARCGAGRATARRGPPGSPTSGATAPPTEAVASASHELLQQGGAAAFSLSSQPGAAVLIALEADTIALAVAGIEEVSLVVRTAVSRTLGVQIEEVLLLPPGSLPRTPIGKVRRAECRRLYLDGAFGPAASGRNR